MGIKRPVDNGFWTDPKTDEFSPEDKYFMLYLLTNPFTKQLGIYKISIKQAAFQLGYSEDAVNVLLERFESKYKVILFSKETSEVAVINYLRHSVMKGGKPVEDCIRKDMEGVKNKKLIYEVFSRLQGREGLNETVRKIVDAYLINNDIDNDIDNDNDNDRTVDDSYHESYHESSKPKRQKPSKHKYGEYKNVLLTDEELSKLQAEFPDWEDRIERLSSYVASHGKSYKSHYATIRNWARKDKEKQAEGNNDGFNAKDTSNSAKRRIGNYI
jgi:hypothetical protein